MNKILITGGGGFVGRVLCGVLEHRDREIRIVSRGGASAGPTPTFCCDVCSDAGWVEALEGVDTVVHLAARVHVMRETSRNPLAQFREVNVEGTRRVAEFARAAGVRRLVFLSSIKVLGEKTLSGAPFTQESPMSPQDPYGISKAEAEEMLVNHFQERGDLEAVIIRPPLVHGPGMGGNLAALAGWIRKGLPLPFGAIDNRRDLLGVDNLCDLIAVSIEHADAPGKRLLAADGEAVSTPQLIRAMAAALGSKACLPKVPPALLAAALKTLGKSALWERLGGNLEVDISGTCRTLGWSPPVSFPSGIERALALS